MDVLEVPRNEEGVIRPESWEQYYMLLQAMLLGEMPKETTVDLSMLPEVLSLDEIVAVQPMTAPVDLPFKFIGPGDEGYKSTIAAIEEKEKLMAKRKDIHLGRVQLMAESELGEGTHSMITGVVLSGAMFHCTRCGALKPATDVGLRHMADGIVRNQPQCSACRSLPSKG